MSTNIQGQGTTETQKANVRLAHNQTPITVDGVVSIGGTPPMHLPSEEEQRRGFWVSHPEVLISQYYPKYRFALNVSPSRQAKAVTPNPPQPEGEGGEETPIDRLNTQAKTDEESQQQGGVTQDGNS